MFSLIIPVYKNEKSIPELVKVVDSLNRQLDGKMEVVFVVDGSPDRSAELLQSLLPSQIFASQLILLSRNFGSFSAIRVGLQKASGEYFAVMAADLQEPPELVLQFFEIMRGDEFDVVVGTREGRADPLRNRLSANLFWSIYRKFVVSQMPAGGVDVFGCNRAFRDCLLSCEESNTSLIALLFWLGFRRKEISYSRRERSHGVSAWTLSKKINYLMDSIFAFTDLPIKLLLALGVAGLAVSIPLGLVVLFARISGFLHVPGYATTVLIVLFFGGANTLGLGLVGSYAWRAYENTKRRPLAIVLRDLKFPAGPLQK
ncbi:MULTISPECIES: glycosyltransferase family 2 protein [Herbaspirillum]|uniref:Glycosyltransferase family 2 protein n=1 Tax=Herbaspirillum huttiense subsp. lycopersici TaxID=3074428 RepID=A0ABU2ETQ3_9BURK|nr:MULTISPECIES: glycosyltransferase family 2 protein [Herbaspirillum]MBP1316181.1 glycosyltransferase involved in cell wall biosynthesis [Herbaspirillum sp. 1130]MDR9851138.1 glycosyltransferase family 2 protein [Herbaspirillum huttiense SE1]